MEFYFPVVSNFLVITSASEAAYTPLFLVLLLLYQEAEGDSQTANRLGYCKGALMSAIYDNWEKLVDATLNRQKLRELALAQSRETSFNSSISAGFDPHFNFNFDSVSYNNSAYSAEGIRILTVLTSQVINAADAATLFQLECMELKRKTQKLELLLHHVAIVSDKLYDRPYRRIMNDTKEVLHKAVSLIMRCSGSMSRLFSITPVASFQTTLFQLDHCTRNISWLLCDGEYLGSPPIAADEPTLCYIWELIAIVTTGSADDQLDAAASMASLAQDKVYRKLIIDEGGVHALFNLLERGKMDGQEYAAKAIVLLGKDHDSFGQFASADACTIFAKVLREGPLNVQATVAWAASELAANDSRYKYMIFSERYFIQLLIGHLSRDHDLNIHAIVTSHTKSSGKTGTSQKDTDMYMKTMASRALWKLSIDNYIVCQIISNTIGLRRFAVHLERGPEELRYNSAMTLMEISAVAERNVYLRRSSFKPSSPVCQEIVKQLFRLIQMADPELLVPCVRTVGNLSRIFRATDAGMISPLVKLLDDKDQHEEVYKEACVALTKFACNENYLSMEYSSAIIGAGGASRLVHLVYSGDKTVQLPALELLCYIVLRVPGGAIHYDILKDARKILEWVPKHAHLMEVVNKQLLQEARTRLELHLRFL